MTTIIRGAVTNRTVSLDRGDGDGDGSKVAVRISSPLHDDRLLVNVKTSDLLDAVRSEFGVLTIDKADLPIVTDRGVHGNLFVADVPWAASLSVEALRQEAYDRLALAEYLEAHPPVDEQQVEQIWNALTEVGMDDADSPTPHLVATRLATAGYRIEKVQP